MRINQTTHLHCLPHTHTHTHTLNVHPSPVKAPRFTRCNTRRPTQDVLDEHTFPPSSSSSSSRSISSPQDEASWRKRNKRLTRGDKVIHFCHAAAAAPFKRGGGRGIGTRSARRRRRGTKRVARDIITHFCFTEKKKRGGRLAASPPGRTAARRSNISNNGGYELA